MGKAAQGDDHRDGRRELEMNEQYPPYFRKQTWMPDEVADFFGLSKSTIYRWQQEFEDFPSSSKVGQKNQWIREDVVKYFEKNL